MSGAEVAGFVLGVLPLLISAIEHYKDILRPINRIRKFAPELEQYRQQLHTQETIFRNECHLLLNTLIGRTAAKEMLITRHHMNWTDSELDEKFARQLGCSGEACETAITLMEAKFKMIEEETESFGLVIQQAVPLKSLGDRAWRTRIGKKLKFAFSNSRLNSTLDDLRKLNQDFLILAAQTIKLDEQRHSPLIQKQDEIQQKHKEVEEWRMVQRVSGKLYEALSKACEMHEEHSAHLRLESKVVTLQPQQLKNASLARPLVRFNMAFSHSTRGIHETREPVWIAVDSTLDEDVENLPTEGNIIRRESQITLRSLTDTIPRANPLSDPPLRKRLKVTKHLRFATEAVSVSPITPHAPNFSVNPSLPDFCVHHDFCKQLQMFRLRRPDHNYIGYLERCGPRKHLVYFATSNTTYDLAQSASLSQLLTSIAKKCQEAQLLHYERLRLARQLASAVLQFHTTPMLKEDWRSNDVIFFNDIENPTSLTAPHLNVRLSYAKSRSHQLSPTEIHNQTFIRNPYLVGLGITLIELAYQAPLSSLREERDIVNGPENKYTDFFVAIRLSKSLGASLGSAYSKIVRKCLSCDFGEGTDDLNDPGLQAVFYKDVVCELERLEKAFEKLQLGLQDTGHNSSPRIGHIAKYKQRETGDIPRQETLSR